MPVSTKEAEVDVLDFLISHQVADGLLRGHGGEGLDFRGRATEAGALKQVSGAVVIPVGGGDGGEVADPGSRSCARGLRGARGGGDESDSAE